MITPAIQTPAISYDNGSVHGEPVDFWHLPATISQNKFKFKSLSNWAFNIAVGCSHACRFCYMPNVSANKLAPKLAEFEMSDPDAEWGKYVLLRRWDERKFLASLRKAEETPPEKLNPDSNRAVIYCSTTDPYQVLHASTSEKSRTLNNDRNRLVRRSLELIRDHSKLNIRILTRSPLAKTDFELFKSFGPRLLFGMSLPTLDNSIAQIYEPHAPAPSQRLKVLQEARDEELNVYVAMAPTYPECDEADLRNTLSEIKKINPFTIFHEPINIRAENVARIEAHARELGQKVRTEVFSSRENWTEYALESLETVERLAHELGVINPLHLWPDATLRSKARWKEKSHAEYERVQSWIDCWHQRISEWPGQEHSGHWTPPPPLGRSRSIKPGPTIAC